MSNDKASPSKTSGPIDQLRSYVQVIGIVIRCDIMIGVTFDENKIFGLEILFNSVCQYATMSVTKSGYIYKSVDSLILCYSFFEF